MGALFATDVAARGMDFVGSQGSTSVRSQDCNLCFLTLWNALVSSLTFLAWPANLKDADKDVHTVIQVGPPEDREQYVHRAGRTGRPERVRD